MHIFWTINLAKMRSAKPWCRARNTLRCCELFPMVVAAPGLSTQASMCCAFGTAHGRLAGDARQGKTVKWKAVSLIIHEA